MIIDELVKYFSSIFTNIRFFAITSQVSTDYIELSTNTSKHYIVFSNQLRQDYEKDIFSCGKLRQNICNELNNQGWFCLDINSPDGIEKCCKWLKTI